MGRIREELLREPQDGTRYKVSGAGGVGLILLGLLLIYVSTDQVVRFLAVGQVGVGLSGGLSSVAEIVSPSRRRLSTALRVAGLAALVVGGVAAVVLLLLAYLL